MPRWDGPDALPDIPKAKPDSHRNLPAYNAGTELFRITAVDLVAVEGFSASLAHTILSEIAPNP